MAILDQVRARVETDLLDPDLVALITDAQNEIRSRFGPDRSEDPLVVTVDGGEILVDLQRPLDEAEDFAVVEYVGSAFSGGTTTTLDPSDFRVLHRGRILQRLGTGPNSRTYWGDRVTITYQPVDDQAQRDEVVIKLVKLALEYEGLATLRAGDVSAQPLDYRRERERLLSTLAPRPGLTLQ